MENKTTENKITELVFILDASGSMEGLADDTIGGYNSVLKRQKEEDGTAFVSTVLFNTETSVLHDRVPVDKVEPMTRRDYMPTGGTALLDAVGGAVHHIGNIHKYARPEDVPAHTLFVITTDGMENASRRYTTQTVKKMIERQRSKYGWEFLFLGANIDAVQTAGSMGIAAGCATNYACDAVGTGNVFFAVTNAVSSMRAMGVVKEDWDTCVREDYEARRQK